MEIKCIICKQVEQLTEWKLKEVGIFIAENKLDAVDFLTYLSLLNGKTCTNNKKHRYEFTEEFDKQIHEVARTLNKEDEEINKLNNEITELDKKLNEARQELEKTHEKRQSSLKNIRELVYIDDPKLWL